MIDAEHHQARIEVVRHIGAGRRHRVDARKIAGPREILAQALLQLVRDLVGFALHLLGAIFR